MPFLRHKTIYLLGWIAVLVAAALVTTTASLDDDDDTTTTTTLALAAYLPDYRVHAFVEQQQLVSSTASPDHLLLTDLILFSLQPHPKGFLGGCCLQQDHYDRVAKWHRAQMPSSVTLWITIGGAGRGDAFSEIFKDSRLRSRLIQSAIKLCDKHSIQGIDMDFTPRTIMERDNYAVFLQEAVDRWHAAGLQVSTTATVHPSTLQSPHLCRQMDRIHLMAYDMVTTKGGDDGDPYHAGLEKVRQALAALLQPGGGLEGTPPEKILLGIPAYARHVTVPTNVKTFAEIHDGIVAESGAGIDWETLHSWQGFEWESGRRIRDKVQLARELGLGGVFFWEIGQDKATESHPRGILIETAAAAIRNETMIDSTADRSSVGAEL